MSEVPKASDNKSVGVIIENKSGDIVLLRRAKFPVGMAPPAGHVDDHGSPERAAVDEVSEEVGLSLAVEGLRRTAISSRRVERACRRPGGEYHDWWVYVAAAQAGELSPSADETKGAGWYGTEAVQDLADRTRAYQEGEISDEDWQKDPGLEEVWLDFLEELGYVE